MLRKLAFGFALAIAGSLFAGAALADSAITIAPGSSITLTPGQPTTVTCSGASSSEPSIVSRYCRCDKSSLTYDWSLVQVIQYSNGTSAESKIDSGHDSDQNGACQRSAHLAAGACNL